jgi:hypothetical protein
MVVTEIFIRVPLPAYYDPDVNQEVGRKAGADARICSIASSAFTSAMNAPAA